MKNLAFFVVLLGLSTLHAAENLLPPLASDSAKAGDKVSVPWHSNVFFDDAAISVKLGSPDGSQADWAELRDDSLVLDASLGCGKLDPVTRGELSFEIQIGEGADGEVVVALGGRGVVATHLFTCEFLPDGSVRLGSIGKDVLASQTHSFGKPRTYRLKFDTESGSAQLFEGQRANPIAELKTPHRFPPITSMRVTTGWENSRVRAYVRDLVLKRD